MIRQALFVPGTYYVYFGGGGNRRVVETNGAMIFCAIINPNGTDKTQILSLLRKGLDLPYGIDWSTGPWWPVDEYDDAVTRTVHQIIGYDLVPTLAEGLGIPLDRDRFGV